jgi:hypothetical protein
MARAQRGGGNVIGVAADAGSATRLGAMRAPPHWPEIDLPTGISGRLAKYLYVWRAQLGQPRIVDVDRVNLIRARALVEEAALPRAGAVGGNMTAGAGGRA